MSEQDRNKLNPALHLLVAADAKAKRASVVEALENDGHRVDVVADGTRAPQAIMRQAYDAVLIDARMRTMDGVETTAAIRKLPSDKAGVPIVALISTVLPDSYERYVTAGLDDDLPDVPGQDQLFALIDRLIGEAARDAGNGEGDVLDSAVLSNIRQLGAEDSTEVLGDLIGLFLDSTLPEMASLLDAVDARDLAGVGLCAHKLKTSCANVGAVRLSEALNDVLELAQAGDLDAVTARRDDLCTESERAYRALGDLL